MPTLLLRLEGPLQAWGDAPGLDWRPTAPWPTKSGVVGLLANALGRSREEEVGDLAALRMGVRVDRPGEPLLDLHTVRGVVSADGKDLKDKITRRLYLQGAAFLVGLEGERGFLLRLQEALKNPARTLYLGRRSCLPSPPPYLPDGLQEEGLEEALRGYPPLTRTPPSLLVLEAFPGEGLPVMDLPVGPPSERRFALRFVREVPL